jgi:hypothetical protein
MRKNTRKQVYSILLVLLIFSLLVSCGKKEKVLGEFPDMDVTLLSPEQLVKQAADFNGKNVLVAGTVVTLDLLTRQQLQVQVPVSNTVITVEAAGDFSFPQTVLNQQITVYGEFRVQTYSNVDNMTLARGKDAIPATYLINASGIKY